MHSSLLDVTVLGGMQVGAKDGPSCFYRRSR